MDDKQVSMQRHHDNYVWMQRRRMLYGDSDIAEYAEAMRREAAGLVEPLPIIVCLCGSTRFWRTFQQAGLQETLAGKIVLSIGAASGTDDKHFGNLPQSKYDGVKEMLDKLHLRKIDMADEVLILDVDYYIGESTQRELDHALALGKRVRYWSDEQNQAKKHHE